MRNMTKRATWWHLSPAISAAAAAAVRRTAAAVPIVAVAVSCSPTPQAPAGPPIQPPTATVLRAVDGDTVDVRDDHRGRLRVRIAGIDTPELHKPGWTVGCGAIEAADYADRMLTGHRVAIISDPSLDPRDKYGRTLAYLQRSDGWNYSIEAARAGIARNYIFNHRPVSLQPQIAAAEHEAQELHRGIWGAPCNGHVDSVKQ